MRLPNQPAHRPMTRAALTLAMAALSCDTHPARDVAEGDGGVDVQLHAQVKSPELPRHVVFVIATDDTMGGHWYQGSRWQTCVREPGHASASGYCLDGPAGCCDYAHDTLYQAQLDGVADAVAELSADVPTHLSVVANTVGAQVPGQLSPGPEVLVDRMPVRGPGTADSIRALLKAVDRDKWRVGHFWYPIDALLNRRSSSRAWGLLSAIESLGPAANPREVCMIDPVVGANATTGGVSWIAPGKIPGTNAIVAIDRFPTTDDVVASAVASGSISRLSVVPVYTEQAVGAPAWDFVC